VATAKLKTLTIHPGYSMFNNGFIISYYIIPANYYSKCYC